MKKQVSEVHGCQLVGLANLQLENGLIIDSGS